MDIGLDSNNNIINISESIKDEIYRCPVCNEELIRNYGNVKRFFSHKKGNGVNCDLKLKDLNFIKFDRINTKSEDLDEECNYILDLYNNIYNDKINISQGFTIEQEKVINNNYNRVKILAKAGASKTTCAFEYAKVNKDKKILYICYNTSLSKEAKEVFNNQPHVEVRTFHALAFKYEGRKFKDRVAGELKNKDIVEILKLNVRSSEDYLYLDEIKELFNSYCVSRFHSIEEFINYTFSNKKSYIKDLTKLFNTVGENEKYTITFDYYLKLWQLKKPNLSHSYDVIIVDEFQDVFMSAFDIIDNSKVKTIMVLGDENQSIYSFRGSVDCLNLFKGDVLELNGSFRIGNTLAHLNKTIMEYFFEKEFDFIGYNKNQKIVKDLNYDKPYVVIARKNSTLLKHILDNPKNLSKKIYFEGGSIDLSYIKAVYNFYAFDDKGFLFKSFKSFEHFINLAKIKKDFKALSAIEMVYTYERNLIKMLESVTNNKVDRKEKADIVLTTIHASKGSTYTIPVLIENDLIDLTNLYADKLIGKLNIKEVYEDLNLLYVAYTRAKSDIKITDNVLRFYQTIKNKGGNNVKYNNK